MPDSTLNNSLSLSIVDGSTDSYVEALSVAVRGKRLAKVILCPDNDQAGDISEKINNVLQVDEIILTDNPQIDGASALLFCFDDAEEQTAALAKLIDLGSGIVIAAETEHSGLNNGLYLVSIPKSGTHLAMELIRSIGYKDGGGYEGRKTPGHWQYMEFSNSHTGAADFLVDTVRRSPFGNRLHPFPNTPTLFIYRHPYDILVSEANYYHKEGKTIFSGYFRNRTFEERIQCLIDDPWLLGTIRERVGKYIPWMSFENVIPISFEELVGEAGGGDASHQERLVWSVILKLQVSADVHDVVSEIFNPESPTFNDGQINNHQKQLTADAWEKLNTLPKDYLESYGYTHAPSARSSPFGSRIEEFIYRPLKLEISRSRQAPPVVVVQNKFGYNIMQYKDLFFAVPNSAGNIDISSLSSGELLEFPLADTIDELGQILLEQVFNRLFLGYNIIRFQNRYYGVPAGKNMPDFHNMPPTERSDFPNENSIDELKQVILDKFVLRVIPQWTLSVSAWGGKLRMLFNKFSGNRN